VSDSNIHPQTNEEVSASAVAGIGSDHGHHRSHPSARRPVVSAPAATVVGVGEGAALTAVGAFAGIGGVELGFQNAGIAASTLIENWTPAKAVLSYRFADADLRDDVCGVTALPRADILAGGFPCTDLSQAGRTAGIDGAASGLVRELFRLLPVVKPTWLVIENVRNMLSLDRGRAMSFLADTLELAGYRWAYRLVDSRAFGVPQRRQRVLLVASTDADPRTVLFTDDAGEPPAEGFREDAHGFYWTEGLRGLGWARDAVPTLKGGSTIGIPSPPAVWVRDAVPGRALVKPSIEDAEAMQGFERGWTDVPELAGTPRALGNRWKMVGNAVTVGASTWLGRHLVTPGEHRAQEVALVTGRPWPVAAYGEPGGHRTAVDVGMWPVRQPYQHLLDSLDRHAAEPLSLRAASGFHSRMERSTLNFDPEFRLAVKEHVNVLLDGAAVRL
jgi:DNA (cytosine-5)-methyltransferase 1